MTVKADELELPVDAARKRAEEALEHVALNDWNRERREMEENRGGALKISELAIGTRTERAFDICMQKLVDNALHAPQVRDQNKAMQIIAQIHLGEMELKLRYVEAYAALNGGLGGAPAPKREEPVVQQLPELPPMSREELTELLQLRRKGLLRP